ncbi:MAG: penicillin-binding protein 2 [Planctomycetota bacterium]
MSVPQSKPSERRADAASAWFLGLFLMLSVIALGRVAQLQLAPSPVLERAVQARLAGETTPGLRGDVVDRRGRVLSLTRYGWRVVVDPVALEPGVARRGPSTDEVIVTLSEMLGLDPGEVGARVFGKIAINDERRPPAETEPPLPPSLAARAGVAWDRLQVALDARAARAEPDSTGTHAQERTSRPRLIRYVPFEPLLDDAQASRLRAERLPGVVLERVPVREYPGGDLAASIVGKVGFGHVGLLGVERTLNEQLKGEATGARYVRDAWGQPLWMDAGEWQDPIGRVDGARLSLDLEIQRIAHAELERGVADAGAQGGRLIAMDPATGELLAMVDLIRQAPDAIEFPWIPQDTPRADSRRDVDFSRRYRVIKPDPRRETHPSMGRNRCVEDVYEPGSTFKSLVWTSLTGLGVTEPAEVFDTHDGRWRTEYGRRVEDVHKAEEMTWAEVLQYSSNIGMVQAAERISFDRLRRAIRDWGFGRQTGIGLPGETAGVVTSARDWNKYTHTSVAFGYEVAVTPVQMIRAFSALARSGEMAGTLPPVRLLATDAAQARLDLVERAVPSWAALEARAPMTLTAESMQAHMNRRWPESTTDPALRHTTRYSMFGKSGTAKIPISDPPEGFKRPRGIPGFFPEQYFASFIAAAPAERPRVVVLVVIDDPAPDQIRKRRHYGSQAAGPVVRRFVERTLAYLGAPPSDTPEPLDSLAFATD